MLELAELPETPRMLEPSAGHGAIADAVRAARPKAEIYVTEINARLREILSLKQHDLSEAGDFLDMGPAQAFDRILMNPPFSNGADADHVRHAFDFLAPRGILVSVMSEGTFYRNDRKASGFRDWLDGVAGECYRVPHGAFRESGTDVATRIVVAVKL